MTKKRLVFPSVLTTVLLLCAGASPLMADDAPSEFHHDFRGQPMPPELKWFNPKGEGLINEESSGLRIKLPATFIHPWGGVGVATTFGFKGDFEVTAAFEILRADTPPGGIGCGIELWAQKAGGGGASVIRSVLPGGRTVVMWNWDKNPGLVRGSIPCSDMTGRLRLKRTGTQLFLMFAPGTTDGDFKEIYQGDFGDADIERIRLAALNGRTPTELDVRLLDLTIRGNLPSIRAFSAARGGLSMALLAGLGLTLLFILAIATLLYRWGRQKETRVAPGTTAEEKEESSGKNTSDFQG